MCPCRDFTQALASANPAESAIFHHWYPGYSSALDEVWYQQEKRILSMPENRQKLMDEQAFFRGFCLENPGRRFLDAVIALIRFQLMRYPSEIPPAPSAPPSV
ncbi:hypothetical protein [Gluconobacter morbifer]|uniref:Uncharacterized protein n=1 Tax=Gluconobacter morbifer G707 TaxID=1088869 RepID=G6XJP5_9PROT|nr:hypothetical protein [Gluconobacter morbifer]EHH67857.1 hypothetical protein GMO_16240 [Gluconobacter morbifer G707]